MSSSKIPSTHEAERGDSPFTPFRFSSSPSSFSPISPQTNGCFTNSPRLWIMIIFIYLVLERTAINRTGCLAVLPFLYAFYAFLVQSSTERSIRPHLTSLACLFLIRFLSASNQSMKSISAFPAGNWLLEVL